MRFDRAFAAGAVSLGVAGVLMVGCLGGDDNTAPPGLDASIPGLDAGPLPTVDASHDAAPATDGTVADSTVPDAGPNDATTSDATPNDAVADTNQPDTFDAGPPTAQVRVAWLFGGGGSTQRQPGYVACVSAHGSGVWTGLLGQGTTFASYDVTRYFTVLAGTYDLRIFPLGPYGDAAAITCDLPDAGTSEAGADAGSPNEIDGLVVAPNATMTFALLDPPDPSTQIATVVGLNDELTPVAGKVHMRFANVSEIQGAVDFGASGGVTFAPWFKGVDSTVHLDPTANANGYRDVAPLANLDTSLDQAWSDVVGTDPQQFDPGDVVSVFAVGYQADSRQFALVLCSDGSASSISPALTNCAVYTGPSAAANARTRIADFIEDSPGPVDLCIKPQALAAFGAPIPLGAPQDGGSLAAFDWGSVSSYLNVHGGFPYDVRLVAQGSASCATGLVPDGVVTPTSSPNGGGDTTLALLGYVSPPDGGSVVLPDAGPPVDAGADGGDAGSPGPTGLTSLALTYQAFTDSDFSVTTPGLRVINVVANPAQPYGVSLGQVDYANVAYGGFARPAQADALGYATEVTSPGGPMSTSYYMNFTLGQEEYTLFLLDNRFNPAGGGPAAGLLCIDDPSVPATCIVVRPHAS